MTEGYKGRIGNLIRDARKHRGLTQHQLAELLGTSQSAINRIEKGHQNLSLEMLARIGAALDSEIVALGAGPTHLRVTGPTTLSGLDRRQDLQERRGRAAVRLAAQPRPHHAAQGRAHRGGQPAARGAQQHRRADPVAQRRQRPRDRAAQASSTSAAIDEAAARRTRSIIMFLGPLLHRDDVFELPYAGGCNLGTRTVEPHMSALRPFGLEVKATDGQLPRPASTGRSSRRRPIVLTERGDTVTENALMAAALHPGTTVIRNASSNYMVQDLCFYLQKLGVERRGHRHHHADRDRPAPTSTSTSTTPPARTRSRRCRCSRPRSSPSPRSRSAGCRSSSSRSSWPLLEEMGFQYSRSEEYVARNGHTRLVDITTQPSTLHAPLDKIHPMPFPGLNIDNLPFFAVIAAVAEGQTLLHDWVYENRAIYLTELNKLGGQVKLLDPHRVMIEGPTHFSGAEIVCPPALRPAVVILLAMLASKGTSVLRSTYVIHRGYEDLAERLNELGANIEPFRDI